MGVPVVYLLSLMAGIAVGFLLDRLVQRQQTAAAVHAATTPLREENARLSARLEAETAAAAKQAGAWEEARRSLTEAFQALSGEALRQNNQAFLDLAKAQLEVLQQKSVGELDHKRQAIEHLLQPIRESLQGFDEQVRGIEVERKAAYAALNVYIQQMAMDLPALRGETAKLVNALKTPNVKGRWGEMRLRRVVEIAGMQEYCDFDVQQEVEEGRPDMIIRLPGNKNIIVDAKTPMSAFLKVTETEDEEQRKRYKAEHARQVREHITELGKRAYQEQFSPTPDFVVMFLPDESYFSMALEQEPELIERGAAQKVIVASPTTLIALLRAVSYGWSQQRVAENTSHITELGKELHKRISDFLKPFVKIGFGLTQAVGHYNSAVGSLESRVLVQARRFAEMGVVSEAGLETPPPVTISPREPQSARDGDNEEAKKEAASA